MNLKENWRRSKEVLGAYFRQGAHELGSVFYGPGTAAQTPEYGMAFTRTPGEIADGLRGKAASGASAPEPDQRSVLDRHVEEARAHGTSTARDRDDRGVHGSPALSPSEPERE